MARYIGAMNQFCSVYLVYVELMTAAVLEHVGSLALADAQSFKFNGGGESTLGRLAWTTVLHTARHERKRVATSLIRHDSSNPNPHAPNVHAARLLQDSLPPGRTGRTYDGGSEHASPTTAVGCAQQATLVSVVH
jgi:hypothetical protein